MPDNQKKLPNSNKEYEESKKARAEIQKALEEMYTIKSPYLDEDDEEDQEKKTVQEKMLEDFSGSSMRIMPKKYDIPDNINVVPPQMITFSSFLPKMPSYGEVLSYFLDPSTSYTFPLIRPSSYKMQYDAYEIPEANDIVGNHAVF